MTRDQEQFARSVAAEARARGIPGWDRELRSSGLDPATWSDGTPDKRFADAAAPLQPRARRVHVLDHAAAKVRLSPTPPRGHAERSSASAPEDDEFFAFKG